VAGETIVTPEVLAVVVRVSEFWQNVDRSAGDDACHPWTGYTEDGYGRFQWQGRMVGAHELARTFTTGEVRLPSLDTCHRCDNPPCCNPRHVRFDSRLGNVRDMHERNRAARPGRLTDAQVRELRERRAAGARQIDLAEAYGLTDGAVSMIVRGLRWPDAGGPLQTERTYARGR
jgi:hypothetical protein